MVGRLPPSVLRYSPGTLAKMDPVLVRFLEKFPTAATAAAASVGEIAEVVGPLGLQERRPAAIIRFSREMRPIPTQSHAVLN